MKLQLRSIVSPGDLRNERITLRALADCDVGDFMLAQSTYLDDAPSTDFDHTKWFPFKPVEKGDLVVVYTKEGRNRERTLLSGKKAHFFYLDLTNTIWDDETKGAILLYAPVWESKSVQDLK